MRKTILTVVAASLVAAGASLAGSVTPAAAQMVDGPEVSWKMSLWGQTPSLHRGCGVRLLPGGRAHRRQVHHQALLRPAALRRARENLDGISLGAFEAAMFCASYHPGKNAPLNVLDLPFLPLADFG